MAKTSGSIRGGGVNSNSDRVSKALASAEASIRDKKAEHVVVINPNGELIGKGKGGKHSAALPVGSRSQLHNTIVTHNHPSGGTFSQSDIRVAISGDVREIRAVGVDGTYSLKRPKQGWKITVDQYNDEYKTISARVRTQREDFIRNYKGSRIEAITKSMEIFDTSAIAVKELSKKYGWKYSYKKA